MSDAGFWVGMGAPAVVDWCEPNYAVTRYIAEFVNTSTSVPMAALGLYGLWMTWTHRDVISRRFLACFGGLALVGLGSVAFHGTLLRGPQALDELPMVYAILAATWTMLHRHTPRGQGVGMAWALLVYAVGFTVAYAVSTWTFLIFLATFGLLTAFVAFYSMWINLRQETPKPMPKLAWGAFISFGVAFFCCWVPEHVLLPCDSPYQSLQLHGWWHILSGLGVYLWVCWAVVDRERILGFSCHFERGFVVPNS